MPATNPSEPTPDVAAVHTRPGTTSPRLATRPTTRGGTPAKLPGSASSPRASADLLARRLYEQLRDRPEADKRFVFRALLARLARFASSERVDVALRSLTACCDAHGGQSVSRRQYDAWRSRQPQEPGQLTARELASATLIRTTFGTWTKALEALGYEATGDARAHGLLPGGAPFTRVELIAALQRFAPRDGSLLSVGVYLSAARAFNDGLDPGDRRVPTSLSAFLRVFGSWARALAAAGLTASAMATSAEARLNTRKGSSVRRRGASPKGGRADYTPEVVVGWLERASRELGTRRLTLNAFDAWARETADAALARGEVVVIPRSKSIANSFGTWKEALLQADLITADELRRHGPGGFAYSDEEFTDVGRQALRHFQGAPSQAAYERWRRGVAGGSKGRGVRGLPSVFAMKARFGSFSEALAFAAAGDPELTSLLERPMVHDLLRTARRPGGQT